MAYFPLCINVFEKLVLCVGAGPQIQDKLEKLSGFGANLRLLEHLTEADLKESPVLVIAGDLPEAEAEQVSVLCGQYHIPVNVVDVPRLCTFFFPALITKGDLTVSVSTGGISPMSAGYLRRTIEKSIPDNTEEILLWLGEMRISLKEKGILKKATEQAFALNRPLTSEECEALSMYSK